MINARIVLFAWLLLAPCLTFADNSEEPGQDLVATYKSIPEFVRANSVIWCEPIPDCKQWTKADPIQDNDKADQGYLGSVFVIIVTTTDEALSPRDEVFFHALANGLKDEKVELTGAAFIPPSADTDELRVWIQAQCLNCP